MLASKLYAATMAAGAPEAQPPEPVGGPPGPPRRRAPAPHPPRAGRPRLSFRRGPRGTTRLVASGGRYST